MLHVIGRIFMVFLGGLIAITIALLVMTIVGGYVMAEELVNKHPDALDQRLAEILGIIWFSSSLFQALSVLPAVIAIVIGEIGHIRSWLYYVIAGGIASISIPVSYAFVERSDITLPSNQYMAIFATAGFAAGLAYWLIAGRKA